MKNRIISLFKKIVKKILRVDSLTFFLIKKYKFLNKFNKKVISDDVLLIRIDLIGDCVMFTNTAKAIRNYYKDRKITVLCLKQCYPIFDRLNIFDEIVTIDFPPSKINYKILKKVIKKIRTKKFDIVLQPQASKLPLADVLVISAKANKRICIKPREGNCSESWIKSTNFIYDKIIDYKKGWLSEFEYGKAFAKGIGIKKYKIDIPYLPYNKFLNNNEYFVVFPGGSVLQKFWEPEKYAKVIDYVFKQTKLKCVILGSKNEEYLFNSISKNVYESNRIINMMGKTSMYEVIDYIGNAKFVISNDTSGAHIAAATRTKSIVIVGGWHYKRFFPYKIETETGKRYSPYVVNAFMKCYYCDWVWDNIKKVNLKCMDLILHSKPCPCISKIGVDVILPLVNKYLLNKKI